MGVLLSLGKTGPWRLPKIGVVVATFWLGVASILARILGGVASGFALTLVALVFGFVVASAVQTKPKHRSLARCKGSVNCPSDLPRAFADYGGCARGSERRRARDRGSARHYRHGSVFGAVAGSLDNKAGADFGTPVLYTDLLERRRRKATGTGGMTKAEEDLDAGPDVAALPEPAGELNEARPKSPPGEERAHHFGRAPRRASQSMRKPSASRIFGSVSRMATLYGRCLACERMSQIADRESFAFVAAKAPSRRPGCQGRRIALSSRSVGRDPVPMGARENSPWATVPD